MRTKELLTILLAAVAVGAAFGVLKALLFPSDLPFLGTLLLSLLVGGLIGAGAAWRARLSRGTNRASGR